MNKSYILILSVLFVACNENNTVSNKANFSDSLKVETNINSDTTVKTDTKEGFDSIQIIDTTNVNLMLNRILDKVSENGQYKIAKAHQPFFIMGKFNDDDHIDTAFIFKNTFNNKDGLIIKYAHIDSNNIVKFGAGNNVLSQGFDDFNWVGEFYIIKKGTLLASNVDKDGEIITTEIPDTLYIELPNDGVFVHMSESCGGGVIYFDNTSYQWIQQE